MTAWRDGALTPVEGERLVVTLDQPVTTDHLTLLQPTTGPRNRWMTKVRLRFDGGDTLDVDLDDSSRAAPGQRIDIGPRTFHTLELTVTGDNYGTLPGYNGLSAVGRRRAPHRRPAVRRWTRSCACPRTCWRRPAPASADHRLTVLLTRQRADQHSSTRSDPELAMARTFTLPTARTFTVALLSWRKVQSTHKKSCNCTN